MMNDKIPYRRIKGDNILGVFISVGSQTPTTMLVRLSKYYEIKKETEFLKCNITHRTLDDKWVFRVVLKDEKYKGVFIKLMYDLTDQIQEEKDSLIAEKKFMDRYHTWENLFKEVRRKKMSRTEIIGLLGELYFMEKYCFPKFGCDNSVTAWVGNLGADKDFQFEKDYFEVKTTTLNKEKVHLNSQTQLTPLSEVNVYLSIVRYEISSSVSGVSITLNQQVDNIIRQLSEEKQRELYIKLSNVGYVKSEEYDENSFVIHDIENYHVGKEFPQIDPFVIHEAINDVEYDLYLPAIRSFKM